MLQQETVSTNKFHYTLITKLINIKINDIIILWNSDREHID